MGPSYSSAGAKAGDRYSTVASTGRPTAATDTPALTATAKSPNLLMMLPLRSEPTARTPLRAKFGENLTSPPPPLTLEAHCPSGTRAMLGRCPPKGYYGFCFAIGLG